MNQKYNFPLITRAFPERVQLEKIMEEFMEFLTSVEEEEKYMEFLDFLHASETFLRHHLDPDKIKFYREKVIAKNSKRGYYTPLSRFEPIPEEDFRFDPDCKTCMQYKNISKCRDACDIPYICPECGIVIKP